MCGSTKAPAVVQDDPVADAAAADAKAAQTANSALALRRKQLAQNSLLTRGAGGTAKGVNTPYNLLSTAASSPQSSQLQNFITANNANKNTISTTTGA